MGKPNNVSELEIKGQNSIFGGFPDVSDDKECACNAGDLGLILGLERSPREGNGNPL